MEDQGTPTTGPRSRNTSNSRDANNSKDTSSIKAVNKESKTVTAWTPATAETIITAGAQGAQTASESTATAEALARAVMLAAVGTPAAAAGTPLAASSQENPRPSPRDQVKISIFYTVMKWLNILKVFEQNSLVSKCKFYKLFLLR
jgi:hypothetical protein